MTIDKKWTPRPLTGKQKHVLRSLAHGLSPVVQLGVQGLTDAVLTQIDAALERHELIKVKLARSPRVADVEDAEERDDEGASDRPGPGSAESASAAAEEPAESPEPEDVGGLIEQATRSRVIQRVGRVLVIYRRHPTKARIELPPANDAAARRKQRKEAAQKR